MALSQDSFFSVVERGPTYPETSLFSYLLTLAARFAIAKAMSKSRFFRLVRVKDIPRQFVEERGVLFFLSLHNFFANRNMPGHRRPS